MHRTGRGARHVLGWRLSRRPRRQTTARASGLLRRWARRGTGTATACPPCAGPRRRCSRRGGARRAARTPAAPSLSRASGTERVLPGAQWVVLKVEGEKSS